MCSVMLFSCVILSYVVHRYSLIIMFCGNGALFVNLSVHNKYFTNNNLYSPMESTVIQHQLLYKTNEAIFHKD